MPRKVLDMSENETPYDQGVSFLFKFKFSFSGGDETLVSIAPRLI
jgi:hypothetical protein